MEPATAERGRAALPQPEFHDVPTSDGTEIRLTHYAMGSKGPIVLAPGYGNAARAFALDTVPKSYVRVPRRARLRRLAARLPRQPRPRVQPHAVHGRRHRDARLAGRHRRTCAARPATDSVQAMGHCVGGLSLFMALGGGLEGVRSATFSALAGHPIPTPGNRLRAGVRLATLFKKLGIKGLNTDYDARLAARPRGRARDARAAVPPRATTARWAAGSTSSTATCSTLERIDEETMDAGGAELLRHRATSRSSSTSRG